MKNYLVKIRGGVEVDSAGKKAGKGPLIAEEISHTLGTSQDQYLFQAVEEKSKAIGVDFYNLDITGKVAKTHTAGRNDENHIPCVLTFEPGIASRDGGHVYEGVSGTLRATPGDNQMTVAYDIGEARLRNPQEYIEKSPTITARCGTGGNNVPAVVFENHSQDSRYKGPLKVAQPVTATYGMGGNNQPLVICLQGNGIDRADTAGCNGKGWTEDVSYTLNTIDRPAVVYSFDSLSSNSMKSSNPNSGCREVEVAKCLDTTIPDPSKNQGGIAIVYPKVAGTLDANYYKGPGERNGVERDVVVYPKKTGTLMANSHPGSYCGQDAYNDMFIVENRGGVRSNQP